MELSPGERAFIERAAVGRLATVGDDGTPHVVPICFVLFDGRFYSVVDEKPKRGTRLQRLRNIESTARAALVIDHYSDDWSELAWVMVRGPAAVLKESAEHRAAIGALREKYPQYHTMALDDRPVIRLTPERVNSGDSLTEHRLIIPRCGSDGPVVHHARWSLPATLFPSAGRSSVCRLRTHSLGWWRG